MIQDQPASSFNTGDANRARSLNFLLITQSQDQRNFFPGSLSELLLQGLPERGVDRQYRLEWCRMVGVLQFQPGQPVGAFGGVDQEGGKNPKQGGKGWAVREEIGPRHLTIANVAFPVGMKAARGKLNHQLQGFAAVEGGLGQKQVLAGFAQGASPVEAAPGQRLQRVTAVVLGHERRDPLGLTTDKSQGVKVGGFKKRPGDPLQMFQALSRVGAEGAVGHGGEQAFEGIGRRPAAQAQGEQGGGEADSGEEQANAKKNLRCRGISAWGGGPGWSAGHGLRGAEGGIRTRDPLITNEMLYH